MSKSRCVSFFLFFFFFLLKSFSTLSQVDFKFGEEFDPNGSIESFVGQIDDNIYSLSSRKNYFLQKFSAAKLKMLSEYEFELPEYKERKASLLNSVVLDNKIILFLTYYNKEDDKSYLCAQRLSEKGTFEGKLQQIDELDAKSRLNRGSFDVRFDTQRGRIFVISSPSYERSANEKFFIKVMDADFNEVWSNEIEFPFRDNLFKIEQIEMDEKDNLWMLSAINEYQQTKEEKGARTARKELKENGRELYSYHIVHFDRKSKNIKDVDISLEKGKRVVDIGFGINDKGELNIAGTYGEKDSFGALGVFYLRMDDHSTIKSQNIKAFSTEFVAEFEGERRAQKGRGISYYVVREFISLSNGGLKIVGELYHSYTVCTTDPKTGAQSCTTYYNYDDIIVAQVSPSGEIEWLSNVSKRQHTANDGGYYSSYAMLRDGDDLYFVFNDNEKNYSEKKKPGKIANMTGPKKSVTTIAHIDADGNVKTKPNSQLKEVKMLLRPKVRSVFIFEDGHQEVICLGKFGKRERVVRVSAK